MLTDRLIYKRTSTADLWQIFYTTTCNSARRSSVRTELMSRYSDIAKTVAARFYALLNRPDPDVDERVGVYGCAGIFLGAAVDRYIPGNVSFEVFATIYVTRRMSAMELGIEDSFSFTDSDDAFDRPTQLERQFERWLKPCPALPRGLDQLDYLLLGLHLIESWSIQDIARRTNSTEDGIQRVIALAAAKLDITTQEAVNV